MSPNAQYDPKRAAAACLPAFYSLFPVEDAGPHQLGRRCGSGSSQCDNEHEAHGCRELNQDGCAIKWKTRVLTIHVDVTVTEQYKKER
jgi:hypothetical protein